MWPFPRKLSARARDKPKEAKPGAKLIFRRATRAQADAIMAANEAIYAAVSRIANTVASMPVGLFKGSEPQPEHPLNRLISLTPHPSMTAFGFVQTMEAIRNTEGNAYALIVPDKLGTPRRLDILNPARVVPMRHPETMEMWYQITLDDNQVRILPGCQIIALRHMSANGELGLKPLDVLKASLMYDKQVKELSVQQLEGVNHGIMLTVPNTGLNDEARKKVVDDFLDAYEKSGQRVVVLEGGLTATTFSQSPIDAQVLDVERITRNRVATVYNIPPHMLGDYTNASYQTAEQQTLEFLQLTILPIVAQWEQELNRKLLSPSEYDKGYRFRFDMEELVRADTATLAEKHQKAIRGGWMTPNEVRKRDSLAPADQGDTLLVSRDLVPLKTVVDSGGSLAAPTPSPAPSDEGAPRRGEGENASPASPQPDGKEE